MIYRYSLTGILAALILSGCVATRPENVVNVCEIFREKRSWYKAALRTEERWGVPVPVSMAFIYQESGFQARAKPGRTKLLWVLPGPRISTAYGYAQALDGTWQDYVNATGNLGARRSKFEDAIDFIGWYNAMSRRVSKIPTENAAHLYFAYHEGNGGYARESFASKPWLLSTASGVQSNADRFQYQYAGCKKELDKNWFFRLFS